MNTRIVAGSGKIAGAAAVAAVGLAVFLFAQDQREPAFRTFEAVRTAGEITIDGRLDEPAWKTAKRVEGFYIPPTDPASAPKPATTKATVLMLWDEKNIYFAAEIEDEDVFAKHTERDAMLYQDDIFEVLIRPSETRKWCYEFEINPLGTIYDSFMPNWGAGGAHRWADFNAGIKAKALVHGTLNDWRDRDKGWTVEFAVPMTAFSDSLERPIKAGDKWRVSFCKYDYSVYFPEGLEMSSTSQFKKLSFHRLDEYDAVVFR